MTDKNKHSKSIVTSKVSVPKQAKQNEKTMLTTENKSLTNEESTDKKTYLSKKTWILLIIIFLCVCGFGVKAYIKAKESQQPMTLYGNVDIRQVNMAFRVDGRLKEMRFEEGDLVTAGDVIAILDIEPIENKLNQAKAQVKQAEAVLENAHIVYNRKTSLCKTKDVPAQECDDATAARDEAAANLAYAKAVLAEAQTAYDDATLKTPSNGIVLVRIYEPGSMISAGLPVYSISLNEKMWARAYIKETELGKVKIGSKMKITTDSTDKVYNGHVGFISPQAEFTPKNIETTSLRTDLVYRVRIIIDNPDDYLKQGMPVTITLAD